MCFLLYCLSIVFRSTPFPRKEMIWSQWGMKENLFADPDVFLCHQCGDCREICPRSAKPAEVLGAIRSYIYTFYGWPVWLARLATSPKNLPLLIGIPLIIILVLWFLSGAMHIPSAMFLLVTGTPSFSGIGILSGIPRMPFLLYRSWYLRQALLYSPLSGE
jgi:quinone-modifying oxidoreductase subunit QmoC